jgi:hypothetical protein
MVSRNAQIFHGLIGFCFEDLLALEQNFSTSKGIRLDGSYDDCFSRALSITTVQSGIVTDLLKQEKTTCLDYCTVAAKARETDPTYVSATLVDRMTLYKPAPAGLKTRF